MNISIVLPAFNEEKRILSSIHKILDFAKDHFNNFEIIVVDDNSTDKTNSIVANFIGKNFKVLRNKRNRGKGYSVKRGIKAAKYPLVLFSDSDLATPIEEITKFKKIMDSGYDVVIASRNLSKSVIKNKQPWYRQVVGNVFPLFVKALALSDFNDTQCGFKLFRKDVADKIVKRQTFHRFSFDVEMLYIAKKLRYKIKEAPVVWVDQEGSTVNPIKDGMAMLKDVAMIRINDMIGKYK